MAGLILASASPRRQQLLRAAGYVFTVHPSAVDELDVPPGLAPGEVAEALARAKAQDVATAFPDDVVLGADTVVEFLGQMLGKPRDAADAERILRLLSGTIHSVITGVAVVHAARSLFLHARVISTVEMRQLSDQELANYIASRQWEGKAGAYGIQDPDPFVTRTSGCPTNIVGLPMHSTAELLEQAGIRPGSSSRGR
ncbi:MAG TPA: Maf family protein [Tepidisphaeraceae bacterium]|jgi:septum formation protein|nr:Maf family protein [Tepidisphaeraceae bacterium]